MHEHHFPWSGMVQPQFRFAQEAIDEIVVHEQFAPRADVDGLISKSGNRKHE